MTFLNRVAIATLSLNKKILSIDFRVNVLGS